MILVNIDPHVILHQKTHVPRAVNFFQSETASQHPVCEESVQSYITLFYSTKDLNECRIYMHSFR